MKTKFLVLFMLTAVLQLTAQWSDDAAVNTLVCTASAEQILPGSDYAKYASILSEDGGYILAWQDGRDNSTTNSDIYAQKFDALGYAKWGEDGIAVCTAPGDQTGAVIASDGAGGAIISWRTDSRDYSTTDYDVYAQRIDSNGIAKWMTNGVAVCTENDSQSQTVIVSDNTGGAILVWRDGRNFASNHYDIYAQRINGDGIEQWISGGVPVCTALSAQDNIQIDSDESSGAVITWLDFRDGLYEAYAQRITSNGTTAWNYDGVYFGPQWGVDWSQATIVSDGTGGCIVVWSININTDPWGGANYNLYAQGVNSNGALKWLYTIAVCTSDGNQFGPAAVSDENGGVNITWYDSRGLISTQRVDSNGNLQWGTSGAPLWIYTAESGKFPSITKDGSGGAVIGWDDKRDYVNTGYNVYAQRIDVSGNQQWAQSGTRISTASGTQRLPVLAGAGSTFIAWRDDRNSDNDIYCQLVRADGSFPDAPVEPATADLVITEICGDGVDGVDDDDGFVEIFNTTVNTLSLENVELNYYDNGSAIVTATASLSGFSIAPQDYFIIAQNQSAFEAEYGISPDFAEPTFPFDGGSDAIEIYLTSARAETIDQFNEIDGSAWSWAGNEPLERTAAEAGGAQSSWTENTGGGGTPGGDNDIPLPIVLSSFDAEVLEGTTTLMWQTQSEDGNIGFNIYRGHEVTDMINDEVIHINELLIPGAGYSTIPMNYSFEDQNEPEVNTEFLYWLESVNLSGETELYGPISLFYIADDEDHHSPELPDSYGLFQNFPNPFNPITNIAFRATEDTECSLEIFNVKGQLVVHLFEGYIDADEVNVLIWNGRDEEGQNVSSGIYYYKLKTSGSMQMKKMILMK